VGGVEVSNARIIRVILLEDTVGDGRSDATRCQTRRQLFTLDGRQLAMTTALGDMDHVYSDNWCDFEKETP
jgi:hypothetical protein